MVDVSYPFAHSKSKKARFFQEEPVPYGVSHGVETRSSARGTTPMPAAPANQVHTRCGAARGAGISFTASAEEDGSVWQDSKVVDVSCPLTASTKRLPTCATETSPSVAGRVRTMAW